MPLKFLAHRPHPLLHYLRSVDLTINFWNAGFSEQECLWASLAELPHLREVRIWLNQEPIPVAADLEGDSRNVSVQDVIRVVGRELASRVVINLPVVEAVKDGYACRGYDFEGAPFRVVWHPRAAFRLTGYPT